MSREAYKPFILLSDSSTLTGYRKQKDRFIYTICHNHYNKQYISKNFHRETFWNEAQTWWKYSYKQNYDSEYDAFCSTHIDVEELQKCRALIYIFNKPGM